MTSTLLSGLPMKWRISWRKTGSPRREISRLHPLVNGLISYLPALPGTQPGDAPLRITPWQRWFHHSEFAPRRLASQRQATGFQTFLASSYQSDFLECSDAIESVASHLFFVLRPSSVRERLSKICSLPESCVNFNSDRSSDPLQMRSSSPFRRTITKRCCRLLARWLRGCNLELGQWFGIKFCYGFVICFEFELSPFWIILACGSKVGWINHALWKP